MNSIKLRQIIVNVATLFVQLGNNPYNKQYFIFCAGTVSIQLPIKKANKPASFLLASHFPTAEFSNFLSFFSPP